MKPRNRKYVLDMFPYPSGAGLHVGHIEGYSGTDVYSKYLKRRGFEVLRPMGWDAFGLPAENYAIKNKVAPEVSTGNNISTFKRQIIDSGLSYDWDREIDSSSPEYYKWTQWIFIQLWKNGLAYKAKAPANWCPSCQTVLANEQVVEGKCERCDTLVVQKELEQWFFGITKYADRLVAGLSNIDWPKSTKLMQANWIGRKEGRKISFDDIEVFTTKPETIRGVTFVVICPEHPKALEIAANEYAQQTKEYIANARNKSELERTAFTKEKTGVFTGRYVVNPVTEEKVPVWIADYVLATTGTGAVMGVPAGDERDMQFAQKFGLPVVKYEDYQGEVGEEFVTYHLRDWLVSRQRYWGAPIPMVCCESCGWNPVPEDQLPVLLPTDVDFLPTGESPIASSKTFQEGVTCPKCGKPARREVDTMDTFVDSSWYFLRFCDPKNINMAWDKERAAEWMPVDMYVGGAEHTVLHLLYSRFFYMVFCDLGLVDKTLGDEPFLKLRHQGTILGEDGRKMSKRWGNVINPDDVGKKFGADTLKMYELFMGPFEATKPWSTFGVEGVARFLGRVERLFDKTYGKSKSESQELERQVGLMVDKVGRDIENLSFNTAIAKMMETLNLMVSEGEIGNHVWEKYILVLEPFAPMLANKLWQKMGKGTDVASESWPEVDIDKLRASSVKVAIQVNGKLRKVIEVAVAESNNEVELLRLAMQDERVAIHVKDKKIKKVFVPGKILNLVTS